MTNVQKLSEITTKDSTGYVNQIDFYSNLDRLVGLAKDVNPIGAEERFIMYRSGELNNRSLFDELVTLSKSTLEPDVLQ